MSRILIVDDHQRRRESIVRAAERVGIRDIVQAPDYGTALEEIRKQRFDFAVVHMFLTDSPCYPPEGPEIIKRLKLKSPETRVAGITSEINFRELAKDATVAGAEVFIPTEQARVDFFRF